MGEVAAKIRVMPESAEMDLEKLKADLKSAIPSVARLHAIVEQPIAFGLKALMVMVILDDKKGGMEETEAALAKVPGVESVEVEEVGLL
jgi:elongation factor 1-beta